MMNAGWGEVRIESRFRRSVRLRSGLRLALGDGRRRLAKARRCPGSRVAAMRERPSSCR